MANTENDDLECFDDKKAIEFIQKNIFPDYKGKLTDDQIQYILDCEYDYYESKGFFEGDEERDVELDEEEEFQAICERVEKDGRAAELPSDVIGAIIEANYKYCEEFGIFED